LALAKARNASVVKFFRFLASASLFVVGVMFVLYGVLGLTLTSRKVVRHT
jgi:hypothetical protein